jgi:CubicO group peptidase (beta-lactamase class C family)
MSSVFLLAVACRQTTESGTTSTPTTTTPSTLDTMPFTNRQLNAVRDAVDLDLALNGAFAAQVAVWYDGRLVWTEGFGTKDQAGADPVDADTLFQIGSDTKKLTALAALQQVEAGRLTLDDTLGDLLPGFAFASDPGWAAGATLGDLLRHQGGMYDYTPWDHAPDDAELYGRTYGDLAENSFVLAPAGSFWNYSNPNFSLAGLAVELADGRPYGDILEQDLFAPLGMTRTFARLDEVLADGNVGESTGILDFEGVPYDVFAPTDFEFGTAGADGLVDNGFTRPAGLVWSTAADHARLLGFLLDGDPSVLADELREAVTDTDVELYPGVLPQYRYGLGMFVYDEFSLPDGLHREPLWTHGGNTLTYTSASYALPDRGLAFTILSNVYGAFFDNTAVALFDLVELAPAGGTTSDAAVERDRADYLATYLDPQFGTLVVSEDDGDLFLDFLDLDSIGWTARTRLFFALTDTYVFTTPELGQNEVTFIADQDGTFRWLRNRLFVGTRVDAARLAPTPIDPQALAAAVRSAAVERLTAAEALRGR